MKCKLKTSFAKLTPVIFHFSSTNWSKRKKVKSIEEIVWLWALKAKGDTLLNHGLNPRRSQTSAKQHAKSVNSILHIENIAVRIQIRKITVEVEEAVRPAEPTQVIDLFNAEAKFYNVARGRTAGIVLEDHFDQGAKGIKDATTAES